MQPEQAKALQNDEAFKESFSNIYARALEKLSSNKDLRNTLVDIFFLNDGELNTDKEPIIFTGQISVFSLRMGKNPFASELIISTINEPENETVTLFKADSGYRLFSFVKADDQGNIIESQENNALAVSRINQFLRGI